MLSFGGRLMKKEPKLLVAIDEWGATEAIVPDEVGLEAYQRSTDALRFALDAILSEDWLQKKQWKQELTNAQLSIYSRTLSSGRTFIGTGELSLGPELVFKELWTLMRQRPEWDHTITEKKVLRRIGLQTVITQTTFKELFAGVVTSRDFIDVTAWRKIQTRDGAAFVISADNFPSLSAPPIRKGVVRGINGPSLILLSPNPQKEHRTRLSVMINMDLKGFLPRAVVERVIRSLLVDQFAFAGARAEARRSELGIEEEPSPPPTPTRLESLMSVGLAVSRWRRLAKAPSVDGASSADSELSKPASSDSGL